MTFWLGYLTGSVVTVVGFTVLAVVAWLKNHTDNT